MYRENGELSGLTHDTINIYTFFLTIQFFWPAFCKLSQLLLAPISVILEFQIVMYSKGDTTAMYFN